MAGGPQFGLGKSVDHRARNEALQYAEALNMVEQEIKEYMSSPEWIGAKIVVIGGGTGSLRY